MVGAERQKVVIIGHGTTSRLGIVRALGPLGYHITVIVMVPFRRDGKALQTRRPFDCYSKYIDRCFYHYAKDGDGLIQLLIDKCSDPKQKVIILPDSDFSAVTIDDNREKLAPFFLFPFVRNGSVRHWMDKEVQKSLARELGLNVAASHSVTVSSGKYTIPEGIAYPCFTKALMTLSGGKQLFKRCDDPAALCAQLERIGQKQDTTVLIEDFKEIGTEYAVLGCSDGKGVIIPGVIKFIANTSSHFGIALKGIVIPIDGFEDLIARFKAFVLRVGFVGVFDIDFYESGGSMYFGEMNLRFGGSGYAITKLGVNLPDMMVHLLRGESIEEMPKLIPSSATYVNERMCIDDWYRGFLTTKQYKQVVHSADISFVRDPEDPLPERQFKRERRQLGLVRAVKRLIKG